ncbi:MAG TPA: HEAT repeat domain-containing protein [Planctomycetota bacterium]|nr:HEAT repeat domain-containing protein [Planctomycetota bacterium]
MNLPDLTGKQSKSGGFRSPKSVSGIVPPPEESNEPAAPPRPGLLEVKEFVRNLVVAERSFLLYPVEGKVVQKALDSLQESAATALHVLCGAIEIRVSQTDLLFGEEVIHHDEAKKKSVPYRLYRDAVRRIMFYKGVSRDDFLKFIACFRSCRESEELEDDFMTLYWQTELSHILAESTDDFTKEEALSLVPIPPDFTANLSPEQFRISADDERRLRDMLAKRKRSSIEGEPTYELSAEEQASIQALIAAEETYFPLYDVADILLDAAAQSEHPKAFHDAVEILRSALHNLMRSYDFEHARQLLAQLKKRAQQGFTDAQRHALDGMLRGLCDKSTVICFSSFFREAGQLENRHPVFGFMKLLGADAIPHLCSLLSTPQHATGVIEVLAEMGAGCMDLFAQYVMSSDSLVARSAMQVLLRIDRLTAVPRIVAALQHSDGSIRMHAVRVLLELGDPRASSAFIDLLDSESPQHIGLALQFFARVPCRDAYEYILALLKSNGFSSLDGQGQDQCFRALVLSDRERALDYIARYEVNWTFCFGARMLRRKSAALRALALEPDARSLAILRRFARKKNALGPVALRILDVLRHAPRSLRAAKEGIHA